MDEIESYYTSRVLESQDLFWQVGKTVDGKPVGDEQLVIIIEHLKDKLELIGDDHIIDLGCGNGLITREIAKAVDSIIGIERNQALYLQACNNNPLLNESYQNFDLLDFTEKYEHINKGYCYEVVQHFTHLQIKKLLEQIKLRIPNLTTLILGGIPDEKNKWAFYDTAERKKMLSKSLLESGKDPIGTWFYSDFFKYLADMMDISCEIIAQPPKLYTSHYRFDCVLRF